MAKLTQELACSRLSVLCVDRNEKLTHQEHTKARQGKGLHSGRLLSRDRTQTRNMALDGARQTKQEEKKK